jgi:hypothetical protein
MEQNFGKHWGKKALLTAGVLGAGAATMKGVGALTNWMGREPPPQGNYMEGAPLPMGVNGYGQPSMGTPLMG